MNEKINFFLFSPKDSCFYREGEYLMRDGQLEMFVNAPECCVFGATLESTLLGIATAGILPKNQLDYRGIGIGRKLLEMRVRWL